MPKETCRYRFGPFELRPRTRELRKQGVKLKLRPQPFQVLEVLLERAGDVVTREELHERVWGSQTFVDFEHGLNTAVKELRGALADPASEPRYIETLPRVGYRLKVPVEAVAADVAEAENARIPGTSGTGETLQPEVQQAPPNKTVRQGARWWVPAGIAAALVLGLFGYWQWSRGTGRPGLGTGRVMLAVLPFENLTGDTAQEYFSDGLTEEMIAQLGRRDPQHLGVIARTSVAGYKNAPNQLNEIRNQLGVQYVLEGSVRREGDKVRVTAKLVQLQDQSSIWTQEYDRELVNLLGLQTEIAEDVAGEIHETLGGAKQTVKAAPGAAPLSANRYAAHDLYLKGLYFWNKREVPGFEQSISYFQQAIDKDPGYAPAYSGLANAYTLLCGYSGEPPGRYMPKAKAAALRAMELDASLPEAHTAWALAVQNYDWDWETSEKEFRRAIELNPNYATAHHWYAEHLMWLGRFNEALLENQRARQLDPLSLIIATDRGAILYSSRQYTQAIEQFQSVRELEPDFPRTTLIVFAFAESGKYDQARAIMEKMMRQQGGAWNWSTQAYVDGKTGHTAVAREELNRAVKLYRPEETESTFLVPATIAIGEKQKALDLLEEAYEQHSNVMTSLKVDPIFDPLRDEPRFKELLRKVKLSP